MDEGVKGDKCLHIGLSMPLECMKSGYFASGANQLHIMEALGRVIDYLEESYGLK